MKFIILTALSPRFNTIGTLRIEKLAKYLSTKVDVQIIAGMPLLPENYSNSKKEGGSRFRKMDRDTCKTTEIEYGTSQERWTLK